MRKRHALLGKTQFNIIFSLVSHHHPDKKNYILINLALSLFLVIFSSRIIYDRLVLMLSGSDHAISGFRLYARHDSIEKICRNTFYNTRLDTFGLINFFFSFITSILLNNSIKIGHSYKNQQINPSIRVGFT